MSRDTRWFRSDDMVVDLNLVLAVNKSTYAGDWEVVLLGPSTISVTEAVARNIMEVL